MLVMVFVRYSGDGGDTRVLGLGVCLAGCGVELSFGVGLIWVLANLFLRQPPSHF